MDDQRLQHRAKGMATWGEEKVRSLVSDMNLHQTCIAKLITQVQRKDAENLARDAEMDLDRAERVAKGEEDDDDVLIINDA